MYKIASPRKQPFMNSIEYRNMEQARSITRSLIGGLACVLILASQHGAVAQTPNVGATKRDSVIDKQGNGQTGAADTIHYRIKIQNTGTGGATGVNLNDTPDANTTLVPGSITATPVAANDAYTATGNIQISIAAPGVLTNDFIGLPTASISAFDATSTQGGNVSVAADGSFTYNAAPGFEGSDTFTYTLTNSTGSDVGTVTITVSGMIWFINNATVSAGDGRLTSPFNTLAAFQAVNDGASNHPAAGDNIFMYTGSGSYTGGVTLLSNQKLIGDGSSSTLVAITGITLAPGSNALPVFSGTDPVIENSAVSGNDINLASGNTVRGLTAGNSPNGFGFSGGAVGTFNIQEASKTGTGGAINISTSGTAGTVQFDDLSSSNAPSQGINLVGVTGTFTVNAGSISAPTGIAVNINGGSVSMTYPGNITQSNNASTVSVSSGHTGTLTFQTGTVSATNGNGLQFDNADGTYNFNGTTTLNGGDAGVDILNGSAGTFSFGTGTTITSPSGIAFNISGTASTCGVTYSGNITHGTNTAMVNISGGHNTGTITFQTGTLSATNGTGLQFDNADGTYNFNGTTSLTAAVAGTDAGIDILNGSTGTFTFGTGTTITRGNSVSGAAFNLASSNANVTYSGSMTLGTSTGNMVAINNHDAGTMNFNTGALSKGSSTTQGINIQNSNGGTINFNNPTISITMTTGNAVSLTNNTGGTMNFAIAGGGSGMDLTTTSGTGFNATGGGTVTVTGSGNTITSTTGTALNVANTTIGASGLNFQSISASGGTASGIILNTTGSTGGLTVNGDGSNTTKSGNSSGGTIANKDDGGTNGSGTVGTGIYLNSTSNVTLRRMTINGTNTNYGIYGSSVTNFTMEYCSVTGTNGDDTPSREGSVIFDNVFGSTNSIFESIISGSIEDNVRIENSSSTVLTSFTISNNNIQNNSTVSGNIGVRFASKTSGNMTGTISNNTLSGNRAIAIDGDAADNSQLNITISNNTITAGTGGNNQGNQGIEVSSSATAVVTYNINANTIGSPSPLGNTGINVFAGGSTTSMSGSVTNNTVVNAGAGVSGYGIRVFSNGSASPGSTSIKADVSSNTVSNVGLDYGILCEASGTSFSSTLILKLTNNNVSVLSGALDAMRVQARNTSTVCARISGNTTSAGGAGGGTCGADFCGLFVRQANTATFNLEGGTGALATNNPGAATISTTGTITTVAANFCGTIP